MEIEGGQRERDRVENRLRIKPVVDAVACALTTVVSVDVDSDAEIKSVLATAEKETRECTSAAESIKVMTEVLTTSFFPTMEDNGYELEKLLRAVEALEEKVIPALNSDLTSLEALVNMLEKQNQPPESTLNSWLGNILSVSTSSAAAASTTFSSEEESILTSMSNFELHDAASLVALVRGGQQEEEVVEDGEAGDSDESIVWAGQEESEEEV